MTDPSLTVNHNRVGNVAKTNVKIFAKDPVTNKVTTYDLAELDDASAQAWLQQIKDWKKKLEYRRLLQQTRVGSNT
jgi:hypothetical protein